MAVFRVEKTKDYTVMSNHHLRNTSISLKAKGLLSLMLSLPEDWDYTVKGLVRICKEGEDLIRAALTELEENGYMTRRRLRDKHGRVGDIEYTIHEQPIEKGQTTPFPPKREKPEQVKPEQVKPVQVNPEQGKPEQGNPAQLNTKESNTNLLNTYTPIHPSIYPPCQALPKPPKRMDGRIERERERVKAQIGYDCLVQQYGKGKLNDIVEIMAEVACCRSGTKRIEKCDYDIAVVRAQFAKLNSLHIQYVLNCFEDMTERIHNIKAYLTAMLFNAPSTINTHYDNKINSQFWDG